MHHLPHAPPLSKRAKPRLDVLDEARQQGVRAASRHFDFARSPIYRGRDRVDPAALTTLEPRSSRPTGGRRPTWTAAPVAAVRQARAQDPRWGTDKLAVVLRRHDMVRSGSMVGRMLTQLNATGPRREAPTPRRRPQTRHARPDAIRKPKALTVAQPGALVQVDTMQRTPLPGGERRHCSAVAVITRYGVVGGRSTATAGTARDLLTEVVERAPFPIQAIPVDGGSECNAAFATACQERGIALDVRPPRRPTRNGRVERVNGTHRREFWECDAADLHVPTLHAALRTWDVEYHTIRPQQALGYQTPAEYLAALSPPDRSHRN